MKLLSFLLFLPILGAAQTSSAVWSELGIKGGITKNLDWGVEINTRFGNTRGVETFFPQVSLKYKVTKWFKPSIDFRYILKKDEFSNYIGSNRVIVNANFEKKFNKRLSTELRLRYQFGFNRWGTDTDYEDETSNAVRLKPEINYDIKNSAFSPYTSAEIFYNLEPYNHQFRKIRWGIGTNIEVDDPLSLSVGYIYDRELNDKNNRPKIRHICTFSIKYKF